MRLSKQKYFYYNSNDLLGMTRVDFWNDSLANKWIAKDLIKEVYRENKLDLSKLQVELNYIQFNLIKSFNNVIGLCGNSGYNSETLLYMPFQFQSKLSPL